MNNFFIFGDSYSYEYRINEANPFIPRHSEQQYKSDVLKWIEKHSYRWPNLLRQKFENDYNFENFSLHGTGPYYSLRMLEKVSNNLHKNDIVVFIVSDLYRFMYSNLPSSFDEFSNNIMCDMNDYKPYHLGFDYSPEPSGISEKFLKYFELNKENIEYYYEMFFHNLKPNSLFLMFSSMFKNIAENKNLKKFIVFFKRLDYKSNLPVSLIDIKNSENYFNYYLELDRVSQDEYVHKTQITRGFDERPNHLSPENHQIMYNNILHIIENSKTVTYNLKPFKKRFRQGSSNIKNFIYE